MLTAKTFALLLAAAILLPTSGKTADRDAVDLSGTWRLEVDTKSEGLVGSWWGRSLRGAGQIPSKPETQRGSRLPSPAALWCQRDILIPAKWSHKRIALFLERPQHASMAWLDGLPLGTNESTVTPHLYELGSNLKPGSHRLTLRVSGADVAADVRRRTAFANPIRGNEHNAEIGIFGRVELQATSPVFIQSVQAYPNVSEKSVELAISVINTTGRPGFGELMVKGSSSRLEWSSTGAVARVRIKLPKNSAPWSEFSPNVQHVSVDLKSSAFHDRLDVTFGLREVSANGRQLLVNENTVFLRGTDEFPFYNSNGCVELDPGSWEQRLRTYKDYGFNFVRFLDWCPPEAAFQAADRIGIYLSVKPATASPNGAAVQAETRQVLDCYGNHPSFVMLQGAEGASSDWVAECRSMDSRHLYATADAADVSIPGQAQVITAAPPPQARDRYEPIDFNPLRLQNAASSLGKFPSIICGMGGWCSAVGPWFAPQVQEDSGRLQLLFYKSQIEASLKVHDISGFDIGSLHDLAGREPIPVGVLATGLQPKSYSRPQDFRKFCNETVVLAMLPKAVWLNTESLEADVEIAHFGTKPIRRAEIVCVLYNKSGEFIARGELPPTDIHPGTREKIGHVIIPLSKVAAPGNYRLVAAIKDSSIQNNWDIWVYPNQVAPEPANVFVTRQLNEQVWGMLQVGRSVLLISGSSRQRKSKAGFAPVRWNPESRSFEGHDLGLTINASHKAFSGFPTDTFAAEQWQDVLWYSGGFNISPLKRKIDPIVSVIGSDGTRLALLFECSVWKGRLMVCGCDLETDLAARPAARQLRNSLLAYTAGPYFNPSVRAEKDDLLRFLSSK